MLMGSVILLNAHFLHRVETCDLAVRPTPPIHSTSNTPDLRESHRSSWRRLWGGVRTPLDAAAPGALQTGYRQWFTDVSRKVNFVERSFPGEDVSWNDAVVTPPRRTTPLPLDQLAAAVEVDAALVVLARRPAVDQTSSVISDARRQPLSIRSHALRPLLSGCELVPR